MANIDYISFWESELAGRIVSRSGENWLARSPFREDRHPSFSVNVSTGCFNDFSDESLRGDAISYVQKRYNMEFKQALEYLGHPSEIRRVSMPKAVKSAPVKQGCKADYTLREIVSGGIFNRGNVQQCETTPDYFDTPGAVDCFHSIYLHSLEIFNYQKQNGGKVAGYPGAVWCRKLVFDIDHKGETIQENIPLSLDGMKALIGRLKNAGLSSFDCAFSGNKGFHVSVSTPLLDKLSGFQDTPKRIQSLARKLAGDIPGIDFSIYGNATRLIRSLNSINSKSGLYKIHLTETEVFSLSPAQIIEMAAVPRRLSPYPIRAYSRLIGEPFTINEGGAVIFESGVSFTKEEIKSLRAEKDKQAVKAIYLIKKSFGGNVERSGK